VGVGRVFEEVLIVNIRPKIGISSAIDYETERMNTRTAYAAAIIKAGGLPIMLPITNRKDIIDDFIDLCDGFLISGGPDIDASYYGEYNLNFTGGISPDRDEMEIKLIRAAVLLNKPVFGICRGCQAINVAFGGTLYQDIYSQIDKTLIRHTQDAPKWYAVHPVNIQKDSRFYKIFGEETILVNSFHHQAIKTLADNFVATGFSPDGIIEAIEYKGKEFIIGAQWHPELMWEKYPIFVKLFEYFVNNCKE
jgi:putative glutamine amidotransferase